MTSGTTRGLCLSLCIVAVLAPAALADLPSTYDLTDHGWVNTRGDCQEGPGPCWAFAVNTAAESSVLRQGLWTGAANDLNLSEQFLRCNETTGTTYPELSPGFSRSPNQGGQPIIGIHHMARLHGPLFESECPFVYHADKEDYYDGTVPDTSYADPATPNWPHARPYPADHTSDAEHAYLLTRAVTYSDPADIKQYVMNHGACYTNIEHYFYFYDKDTGTYYDDGRQRKDIPNVPEDGHPFEGDPYLGTDRRGLTAHAMNIIGWDDTKLCYDSQGNPAPNPGAWRIKHSHPTNNDWSPTTFWVSYDSDRFMSQDATFFEMAPAEDVTGVYFHDFTGGLRDSVYLPDGSDTSVCANRFVVEGDDPIGKFSFMTRADDQAYVLRVYDDLADLEAGTTPLAEFAGTAEKEGYHLVSLADPLDIADGDDFLVFLDFTDGTDQVMAYTFDSAGNTSAIEMIEQDWCYYYDAGWQDLADHWDGEAFTVKAYSVPEPATLALVALGGLLAIRHRRS